MSNEMMRFSYKGGCVVHKHAHIEVFKTRAGLGYDKWFWLISNTTVPLKCNVALAYNFSSSKMTTR